jgi:hypothetical protein
MKHLLLTLIFICACCLSQGNAQEVVSSGGTHYKGATASLAWTIGEIATSTYSGGGYVLTQGFHQTKLSALAIDDLPMQGLALVVYPNPTQTLLHLKVDEGDYSRLQYSLLTLAGKTLTTKKISKDLSDIDMLTYPAGNYLLQVKRQSGELIKTFKVIKIQ